MSKSWNAVRRVLGKLVLYRRPEKPADFAFGWFLFFIALQVSLALAMVRFLLPGQFQAWYICLSWFVALHGVLAMFEFMFHRYVLHKAVIKLLASFKEKHTEHHLLTPAPKKKELGYAIETEEQHESSAFPGYAFVAFLGVFALPFGLLQLALPNQPVILAGILAIAFSLTIYELKHFRYHLPFEKYWKRRISGDRDAREDYGFHLLHHTDIGVNMAIGGFLGSKVLDKLFGTYYVPLDNLPFPAGTMTRQEMDIPEPHWPIRQLDRWVERLLQRRSEKARLVRAAHSSPP